MKTEDLLSAVFVLERPLYIPEDGNHRFERPDFTLENLQEKVGGYIESVPMPGNLDLICFVNEDGRRLQMSYNAKASELCGQPIVGPAVIMTKHQAA